MKKTFPLKAPGKEDARVRDKIRHELNKYARRERKKKLPEGFEEWNLTCKVGASVAAAAELPLKEVGAAIDQVAAAGATEVYVEIVAVAGHRVFKRSL
jgi:transposase